MKKLMTNKTTERGFTLLELIITLTIVAIGASLLVAFMGTAITKSSDPVKQVRNLGTAGRCMESVSAAYGAYMASDRTSAPWNTFKTACSTIACQGAVDCSPVASGSEIYNDDFETIQVTITAENQKIISYFMQ